MNDPRLSGASRNPVTDHMDLWTSALLVKSTAGRGSNGRLGAYGIKRLRELILELAVRGKLLPQDPNDEPAAELLKRAQSDKAKMIKNGKIKRDKDFLDIAEDEIPFDCPFGWQWARINDVGHDLGQKTPDGKFTYIDVSAIDNSRGVIDAPTVLSASDAPSRARKMVKKGAVIYSTVRPYLKNICVLAQDYSPEPIASTAFAVLYPFQDMPGRFLAMYFRSPEFVRYVERVQTGIAYPAINDKQFYGGLVPIPPLAEQHRIVAKVDELMALCDQLEQQQGRSIEAHQTLVETLLGTLTNVESAQEFAAAWSRIAEHFDTLFTTERSIDQLKQTILQLAVTGKLVPQDSKDGDASELLKRATAEKKRLIKEGKIRQAKPPIFPVDTPRHRLPSKWVWTNLFEIGEIAPRNEEDDAIEASFIPMEAISEKYGVPVRYEIRSWGEIKSGFTHFREEDVVLAKITPCFQNGKSAVMRGLENGFGAGTTELHVYRTINACTVPDYVLIYLKSPQFINGGIPRMTGTAGQKRITRDYFAGNHFPLPPLAEQHRIVAKVDELMALCDALKARLAEAQTTQVHLADAIVERAVAAPEPASA